MLKTPSVMSRRPLAARKVGEDRARRIDVAMREHLDGGAAQARAVDDARVIQFVGDDDVVASEECSDGAGVCREAALEDHCRFGPLERGEAPFQLHVDLHRARDGSHRAGADAERREGIERAVAQSWMRREPEIVVRRQIDDRAVVDRCMRRLLAVEHAQRAEESLIAKGVQLTVEVCERIRAHSCFASVFIARLRLASRQVVPREGRRCPCRCWRAPEDSPGTRCGRTLRLPARRSPIR